MLSALSFLDMLLQFRTGYVDRNSKIIINPKKVSMWCWAMLKQDSSEKKVVLGEDSSGCQVGGSSEIKVVRMRRGSRSLFETRYVGGGWISVVGRPIQTVCSCVCLFPPVLGISIL